MPFIPALFYDAYCDVRLQTIIFGAITLTKIQGNNTHDQHIFLVYCFILAEVLSLRTSYCTSVFSEYCLFLSNPASVARLRVIVFITRVKPHIFHACVNSDRLVVILFTFHSSSDGVVVAGFFMKSFCFLNL